MGTQSLDFEPLPDTRNAVTKRVIIGAQKIYITTGEYADGRLGEFYIRLDKEGSKLRVYEILSTAISLGLQHGIPLSRFVSEFEWSSFEPAGFTDDKDVPSAKSVIDWVVRWLWIRYDDHGRRKKGETNITASNSDLSTEGFGL